MAAGPAVAREAILTVEDLYTYYGLSQVLFGVSLQVARGECVCLLGRNGVGKTTTMRSIIGLTPPRRREVHRSLAFSLEQALPPEQLSQAAGEIARHADRGGEPGLAYRAALKASRAALERIAFAEALSWLDLASGAFLCSAALALLVIDAEFRILPDRITLTGIAVGLGIEGRDGAEDRAVDRGILGLLGSNQDFALTALPAKRPPNRLWVICSLF